MEVGEDTAYVRLKTRFSSNGRLERWVGDLTGITSNRTTCMVNACKEDTSEGECEEFRKLAMVLKDMRHHMNIVEVIAVEVEKGKLAHPGIRCQKVLLTESLICKIYDFCTYPVTTDIINKMIQKNNSVMSWLAIETRANRTHTFKSDSFSSAVFVWEVFSWGEFANICNDLTERESMLSDKLNEWNYFSHTVVVRVVNYSYFYEKSWTYGDILKQGRSWDEIFRWPTYQMWGGGVSRH
ncbi:hypothetical protein HOLleu_21693 [Holothuria leucospilota]|uniref:Serine-threonine/tyrosine-protein kinase catalytic domain-containing protein n=1 Tax=Holothuria leucospilota TaxID=206669 RepID=A0A9Q1BY30_HOLLE|nr:hypothetical protein HOLleu_21693 [Holothuria leucospilota]